MTHDEALFAGTAPYYMKYRIPYPQELIDDIVSHFGLDGTGRLLDLGCGPGTLTLPLAPHFASVVAIDPQPEMIKEAHKSGAKNVDWREIRAEEVPASIGRFRVVSCGSSFHWMERDLVLRNIQTDFLEDGGGIVLVGGGSPWWDGKEDWQQLITRVIRKYLGDVRGPGTPFAKCTAERFQETLRRVGWRVEVERGYEPPLERTIDSIVGHLWSTSFAARPQFGARVDEFERELRTELAALPGDGTFRETGDFGLVCGRPPG